MGNAVLFILRQS